MSETFGQYLKELRKSKGYTVRQLSTYSNVSHAYISQLENDERGIPSPKILKKLHGPLGVTFEELMIKAGHLKEPSENEEEYDFRTDPTISPELHELLETLSTLPLEEQVEIINQALIYAAGKKARSRSSK